MHQQFPGPVQTNWSLLHCEPTVVSDALAAALVLLHLQTSLPRSW